MQIKANKTPLQQAYREVALCGAVVASSGTVACYPESIKTGNFASDSIPVTGQTAIHHFCSPSIYLSG